MCVYLCVQEKLLKSSISHTVDYSFPGFLSLEAVVMLTAKVNLGRMMYVGNTQDSIALFLNVVLS